MSNNNNDNFGLPFVPDPRIAQALEQQGKEEQENIAIIKETLKMHPKFMGALRFFFKGGGNLFDFTTQYSDAMTLALRAAKADGEQNVLAFLDNLKPNNK